MQFRLLPQSEAGGRFYGRECLQIWQQNCPRTIARGHHAAGYRQVARGCQTGRGVAHFAEVARVYLLAHRRRVMDTRSFEHTDAIRADRISPDELRTRRGEIVMTCRGSMLSELRAADCLVGSSAAWSMWAGNLVRPPARAAVLVGHLMDEVEAPTGQRTWQVMDKQIPYEPPDAAS